MVLYPFFTELLFNNLIIFVVVQCENNDGLCVYAVFYQVMVMANQVIIFNAWVDELYSVVVACVRN